MKIGADYWPFFRPAAQIVLLGIFFFLLDEDAITFNISCIKFHLDIIHIKRIDLPIQGF